MTAKNPEFVICVEAIIYLLLHNLHDCTFEVISEKTLRKILPGIWETFYT